MKKALFIIVGVLIVFAIYLVGVYNGLITLNESVNNQWAQVESQYQRRFDLIPNLARSAERVMQQEKEVFAALAEARTRYSGAQSVDEKAQAATQVESALGRLLVVMENYPQLRSSENVQTLMAEIAGTENRISVERMRYNELVRDFNVKIKRIPGSLFAGMLGFSERAYFEAVSGSEQAPQVFTQ